MGNRDPEEEKDVDSFEQAPVDAAGPADLSEGERGGRIAHPGRHANWSGPSPNRAAGWVLGTTGGGAGDSLDPTKMTSVGHGVIGYTLANGLTEIEKDGETGRRTGRKLGIFAGRHRVDLQAAQGRDFP